MPIEFKAADPLDVNAASGYGAAQQFSHDLPAIAGLYESAGRNRSQSEQAALDRQAHAQQAIAGLSQRTNEFNAAQDHATQRDLFESTHAIEMQQQKAQLTDWLNGRELSQKEALRLQSMENGVADVLQNPDLSGEEKQNLVMKLRTGIDVYRQRQERAMAAQEEAHAKAYVDQAKRQTQIANANAALSSQTLEQRVNTVFDAGELQRIRDKMGPGATDEQVKAEALRQGAYSQVLHNGVDQYGNIKDHVLDGHGRNSKGGSSKAEKPVTRFGDEHGEFSYAAAEKEAKAIAEAKVPVVPEYGADGKMVKKDKNAEERAKVFQEEIGKMHAEHFRKHGGAAPAGTAQQPQQPAKIVEGVQSVGAAAVDSFKDADSVPPAVRSQGESAAAFIGQVVGKYGSTRSAAIPPEVQQRVQMAEAVLTHIKALTSRPAAPQPSGARQAGEAYGAGYAGEGS